MKNFLKFASLLLFLTPSLSVNAQISIGPKVGINIANYGGEDAASDILKPLLCFQFGAVTQLRINESFAIQPEFLFYQKGAKFDFEIFGEDFDIKQTLNYFEMPILAKFMFFAQEDGQVYGTVGPSFGFGLNGKTKYDDTEEDIDFDADGVTRLDVSLTIGAGIQIPTGPGKWFFDVRYLLGLNSINDSGSSVIKNRGVAVGFGYILPLG